MDSFAIPSPDLPTSIISRFQAIARAVTFLLVAFTGSRTMTAERGQQLQRWFNDRALRVIRLIEAIQSGTLRTRRSPMPGLTRQRVAGAAPAVLVPRAFGWLRPLIPGHAMPNGWLVGLLAEQEMTDLLARSPRLVRALRPLCRMLAVEMPKVQAQVAPALPPAASATTRTGGAVVAGSVRDARPAPTATSGSIGWRVGDDRC